MYIIYKNVKYSCECRPAKTMVYSGLPDNFPAPVSGDVILCADDGFKMRTDNPENFLGQSFADGILTFAGAPENQEPTTEEILNALLGVTE